MTGSRVAGSFRDPSGFVFRHDGTLYRQVNRSFAEQYDLLMSSGLYQALVSDGLLVPHEDAGMETAQSPDAYKVLRPEEVPFVSYPYEWCFSQLKAAAVATLRIQQRALEFGMSLRDANAYNIQFVGTRPVLIDTLSFERLREGEPWVGYRQFCQHFLAPLALMSYTDGRLARLFRVFIDGVPLDLAVRLLPRRALRRPGLFLHVRTHARAQKRYQDRPDAAAQRKRRVSPQALRALVQSLERTVNRLRPRAGRTVWTGYYSDAGSYTADAFEYKRTVVDKLIAEAAPATVWDLGANVGMFSRLAAERGARTISFELDHNCVDEHYREAAGRGETRILPLVLDLSNPSPRIGWNNAERMSLTDRGPADLALALALVHHLAIGNNVPLPDVAEFLRAAARRLIVEWVPKSDPQVKRMLATREDVFSDYSREGFERAFRTVFEIERVEEIPGSERLLYLMR